MLVISLARLIVEALHTMLIGDVGEAVLVRMRARTRRLRHPPDPRERNDERATHRNRAPATINKTTTYKNNLEELRNHNAWPEKHHSRPAWRRGTCGTGLRNRRIAQSTSGCAGPQEVPQHRHLRSDGGVQRRIDVGRKERRVI